ncbi:hypothetical protein [Ekhidna sp.]|uniref:hypothetical protein n=1 Tax=Ekhidna sp. TaxID=2608089 RepID=UPI003B59EBC7
MKITIKWVLIFDGYELKLAYLITEHMNVSIISTYGRGESKKTTSSKKITQTLLELAEVHLESPETSQFISREGVEKLKKKLAS